MLLRSIKLHNIRSYEEFSPEFEEGITLLSGDIGAGKSTILQSVEFALFGIQRGGLEGEGLLRHGADEGSVELSFSVQESDYVVFRNLKRSKDAVRQTEGSLTVDGQETRLSVVELKAKILEILGYPEQLLTKSKGLIFRYTVYTPQEAMKQIIFMPPEGRLNILRVLFGIQRYRTIKENGSIFSKHLKDQERFLQASFANEQELSANLSSIENRLVEAKQILAQRETAAAASRASVNHFRNEVQQARQVYEYNLQLKSQKEYINQRIKTIEEHARQTAKDIEHIDEYLQQPLNVAEDCSENIDETRQLLNKTNEEIISAASDRSKKLGEQ